MSVKKIILITLLITAYSSRAQTPVDRDETLMIGGIKQFIRISGKDNSKPLLLFLHGGPGGSVMGYANKFTDKLQKHFIVVQWDQRETARTRQLNASPAPLTVALFQNDTRELIDSLLKKFNRPKLFLAGYSWGTYLGFKMAEKCPELLYAYIAISPMIHQAESERIILQLAKDKALEEGNEKQLQELSAVKIPFENGEQLYDHRKALFRYIGSGARLSRNFVMGWATTWLSLFNEASGENLMESLPAIQCPVYFCVGRKDFQTNFNLTEAYYNKVTAPKKNLFWFERSAHTIPNTEPGLLQDRIIEKVLPETYSFK